MKSSAPDGTPGGGERAQDLPGGRDLGSPPFATEATGSSRPGTLYKQDTGEGPPGDRSAAWKVVSGLRHRAGIVRDSLVGIELNPGPLLGGRARRGRRSGIGTQSRRDRNFRRNERRRRRRRQQNGRQQLRNRRLEDEKLIVTWNVQSVSMREENRRRLRRICEKVEKEGWEIVLLTEVTAAGDGVIWLGEGGNRVAIIHSVRAGILLRGDSLVKWIEDGQQKWFEERVVSVVVGGMRLVSMYQPIWESDEVGMERCRRDVETQLGIGRREKIVIGGDFNASVGRNRGRNGVYGNQGLGRMNESGRDFVQWCEMNGLAYVNSYMRHERRGTWQHPATGVWYELDGFLVRKEERHKLVKRMRTMTKEDLSDHEPKGMTVRVKRKRWRTEGGQRRTPRIKWEALQLGNKREEFKEKTQELMDTREVDEWKWEEMSEVMIEAAKEVCGETTKPVANPWTIGREDELDGLRQAIMNAVGMREERLVEANAVRHRRGGRLQRVQAERELEEARMRVRESRRRMKRRLKELEREWWQEKIDLCEEACAEGRIGEMYKILKELGMRDKPRAGRGGGLTAEDFKGQFERVSCERYEELPEVIEGAVRNARDLRGDVRAIEANESMNRVPSVIEIEAAMKVMKESAPGEDGVRISYIRYACEEMKGRVIEMVQKMFVTRAHEWSEKLKGGVIVPLYKKGDREDPGNYRGVCLLAMGSRILARVVARRLGGWAEHLGLLDENQAGFRKGRSTADVTQMMVRINEDVWDMKRRVAEYDVNMNEDDWPVARLLDLRKAYPRVNKPALWSLLERCGLNGYCLNVIMDLHESTEYKVRAQDGMSETWMPARGLREGCSTSPILFNVYHQAVMRQVEEARRVRGSEGIVWKWVPGGSFAGERVWERGGAEAVSVELTTALFADDTNGLGKKGEMDENVREMKEVMGRWEERDNEDKEETLEFGTIEGGDVRVLGSWLGANEDVSNRKRRAGALWGRVKDWLKGSNLSKRWQARIVEACVESSLLYDCQARVWYKKDTRKLQQFMDKCYRYVWSDRNGEPLRQMEANGVNMQDVRSELGVKSVRWKIEKRVLERIGHVVRMGNERLTKAAVFGWYERLEGTRKVKGRKRKTVLYWKRMMREAGWDWTNVERLASDRKGWKSMVRARMEVLDKWECQQGHQYEWGENEERVNREVRAGAELECKYDGCGKVCRSKAGLTVHQKRMHRAAEERVRFPCVRCDRVMETEVARENHERRCMGDRMQMDGRLECGRCGRAFSRTNISEHRRRCMGANAEMEEEVEEENNNDMHVEEEAEEDDWFEGFETEEERLFERFEVEEEVEGERMRLETIEEEEEEDWHEGFEVEEVDRWRNRRRLVEEAAAAAWAAAGGDFSGEGSEDGEDGEEEDLEGANGEEEERMNAGMEGAPAGEVGRVVGGRVLVGRRIRCRLCGQERSYTNMARHERICRRIWDPGGGPHP